MPIRPTHYCCHAAGADADADADAGVVLLVPAALCAAERAQAADAHPAVRLWPKVQGHHTVRRERGPTWCSGGYEVLPVVGLMRPSPFATPKALYFYIYCLVSLCRRCWKNLSLYMSGF